MAQSKHRPKFKAKKKANNIKKQRIKEMENQKKTENPLTFVYAKDRETVEVPLKMWQSLNQAAQKLEAIAVFVTTMELMGQQHMQDGTLIPVFERDTEEIPGSAGPDGKPQKKIKDSFWDKTAVNKAIEKPTLIMADGKTIYDATKEALLMPEVPLIPESKL